MRDMCWKSLLSHLSAALTGAKIAFFSRCSTVPTQVFANQGGIQSCRPINSVSCLCIPVLLSILSLTWAIIVIGFFGPCAFLDFLNLFSSLLSSMVQSPFHHVQKIRAARAPERRYFRMLVYCIIYFDAQLVVFEVTVSITNLITKHPPSHHFQVPPCPIN